MVVKKSVKMLFRLLPIGLMALMLSGCGIPELSALQPRGEGAEMQLEIIKLSLWVMLFVLAIVAVIYIYVLMKFRRKSGDNTVPKQVEGNHTLEIIWTVIPILLLIVLAIPTIKTTVELADAKEAKKNEQINVTANLYWWEFEYPDKGVSTGQELVIPVGKRVAVNLTSKDVIHSFWVPALSGKTDTNPGLDNEMWLQAKEAGTYYGKCAELCGPSHALMDFKVVAMEQDDYDKWLKDMKSAKEAETKQLDKKNEKNWTTGEKVYAQNCLSCHGGGKVAPSLTNFGDRQRIAGYLDHDKENLEKWIRDPQKEKQGTKMPGFSEDQISDEELSELADYLLDKKLQ
ncbi:cytochrome c oxidase subunit II [Exiguobacterium sp.]|uniref:cytochrome c oxidase subunit II n=1 Tax=Exiguobacterium sp. TaxID=44751 RepID=UPI0028AA1D63|nr:cytochrome c oxidase subunit II [Exiguobacterium sp.]